MEDDDFKEEDFDGAYLLADAGKKCTVYVIDGFPKMFEGEDGEEDACCAFRRALKIMRLQMVNKAVTSKEEYTACIIINTASKSHNIDNVFVWQDVDLINAERVRQVDELLKSDDIHERFKEICGGHGKANYSEVIFLCIRKVTSKSPRFQKRVVYFFTNEADPFGKSKQHLLSASKNAEDLRQHGAEFAIFPLLSESEDFAFKYDILEQLDPGVVKNSEGISELEEDIPRKQYARRNISSVPFTLGGDLHFSVGIYSLIRPEKLPTPVALDAEENLPVQRSFIYTNKETKEEMPLLDEEIKRVKEIGGAEVTMTADEIEKIRRMTPPGLLLLGFKPASCLKLSHHLRSSQYVFPLETATIGATKIYRALWETCLKLKKIAVCRYTQKQNTPPKLVVLVPQAPAKADGENSEAEITSKFRYPGFHLVYLPFFEDKRDLTEQMTHPNGEWPKADEEQISAARKFIRKLTVSYYPEKFYNPVLQKHYKVIEGLALNHEEIPEVVDQTEPYFENEAFRSRVEKELREFRSLTLPEDYSAEKKKVSGKSRKSIAIDLQKETPNKKRKLDVGEKSLEYLANHQQLASLTVTELKARAAELNIPYTSKQKKADLITAIEVHFGIE